MTNRTSTASRNRQEMLDHQRIFVICDQQRYECVGRRKHTTKDGRNIELLVFQSNCASCGNQFELAIGEKALETNFSPNRRCSNCKQPGKPVRFR
jgi:hypothetical protein